LAVVAAIAATAFFVRTRGESPLGRSLAAGPGGLATGGERVATGSSADVPDVSRADAEIDLRDLHVLVSATPRPLRAFARNRFRFRAERNGAALPLPGATVSFAMAMPMGDHRYSLVTAANGWQETEVVLPACPSGQRRWFGRLDFQLAGKARSARFTIELLPGP
jgi:hypothetical protein